MSEHFHQGSPWDCKSIDIRLENVEAQRDALQAELAKVKAVAGKYKEALEIIRDKGASMWSISIAKFALRDGGEETKR